MSRRVLIVGAGVDLALLGSATLRLPKDSDLEFIHDELVERKFEKEHDTFLYEGLKRSVELSCMPYIDPSDIPNKGKHHNAKRQKVNKPKKKKSRTDRKRNR